MFRRGAERALLWSGFQAIELEELDVLLARRDLLEAVIRSFAELLRINGPAVAREVVVSDAKDSFGLDARSARRDADGDEVHFVRIEVAHARQLTLVDQLHEPVELLLGQRAIALDPTTNSFCGEALQPREIFGRELCC